MRTILVSLLESYFRIRAWYPMWLFLNRKARKLYRDANLQSSPVIERITKDLEKNSIAITSLDELFPNENLLLTLQSYEKELEKKELKSYRKTFLRYLFPKKPFVEISNPFFRLALNQNILSVVASYLRMAPSFYYATLNITDPIGEDPPRDSMLWHRDPEDKRMCKMFIYLTDVDENSGPFIYVKQSTYGRKYGSYLPQRPPKGYYPVEGAVEKKVEGNDITVCTGKAGTVVFADTSGLHKGGYAKLNKRVMFTAGYCTRVSRAKIQYKKIGKDFADYLVTPLQTFAITHPHKKFTSKVLSFTKYFLKKDMTEKVICDQCGKPTRYSHGKSEKWDFCSGECLEKLKKRDRA